MHSDLYHQRFEARFSDGASAGSHDIVVELTERGLVLPSLEGGDPIVWPYGALSTAEPLTDHAIDALVTYSYAPGATLFVPGARFARSLAKLAPHLTASSQRWKSASPWIWGTVAVVAIAGLVWMANWSPARTVASMLPDDIRNGMGRQVVASMTRGRKVCAEPNGKSALKALTGKLSGASGSDKEFNVVVIDWDLVNAFAAPGENVVLTRGLLNAAESPDEVAGVLAHEMGHGLEMHPETGLVRAMGLAAAAELMLGGGGGTLSNLGLLLVQLSYSRDAEQEADDQALRILKNASISPTGFAAFFKRMRKKERDGSSSLGKMLSTHPDTGERLAKALASSGYRSSPALSDDQWRSLKTICPPAASP